MYLNVQQMNIMKKLNNIISFRTLLKKCILLIFHLFCKSFILITVSHNTEFDLFGYTMNIMN